MPILQIESNYSTLIFAGLLVGFGTRMGSGCTSGHAVCGISRFSIRSLIATLSFMLSGFLCAYLFFHGIWTMQLIIVFASGLVFGLGLIISGMSNPQNVIQFLDITSLWNPSLLLVMLGAIPVTSLGFYWACPLLLPWAGSPHVWTCAKCVWPTVKPHALISRAWITCWTSNKTKRLTLSLRPFKTIPTPPSCTLHWAIYFVGAANMNALFACMNICCRVVI